MNRPFLASLDKQQPGNGDLYLSILRALIGDETNLSFLDLGCGEMTATRHINFRKSIHVDLVDEEKRPAEFLFVKSDVLGHGGWSERRYDVALCSDCIEHLTREDGLKLAKRMVEWAKLAILFTPLGSYLVFPNAVGPHQHRSGWLPKDLPGWETLSFPNWHETLKVGALWAWHERP